MSYRPPGTLGVLRILAGNSMRRLFRAADVQKSKRQHEAARPRHGDRQRPGNEPARSKGPRRRKATRRKSGSGMMWLMLLMVPLFVFQSMLMSRRAVDNLSIAAHRTAPGEGRLVVPKDLYWEIYKVANKGPDQVAAVLAENGIDEQHRPPRSRIERAVAARASDGLDKAGMYLKRERGPDGFRWRSDEARRLFVQCGATLLLLLTVMGLCSAFGAANTSLGGGDWVQWWLMTFPVATRSLVLARALEFSLVQFFPWFTLFPLSYQLLSALGQPWALPIAIAATLATTFLSGAVRLWGETHLRLRFSLHTIKNIQGACTLLSLAMIGLVFWLGLTEQTPFVFVDVAGALPEWLTLLPGAWPIGLPGFGALAAIVGIVVTCAAFGFSIASTSRSLRGGVMRTGGVDAGQRRGLRTWARGVGLSLGGKELALLKRDRTFLVQTLLVPLFIIVLQLIVNPKIGDAEGVGVAIIAYVVGFYGATGGCFQVLSSEGRALWMLYSLPISAEQVLRHKTRVWATVCCVFGTVGLVVFSARGGFDAGQFAVDLLFVLAGVWCAAHIAAAISVMGANTTPDSVQRQPKQRYAWLFLFLAGSYSAVLGLPEPGHRIAGATVFATISYAMWQRAADRMRWLLDPVTDPRDRLTLIDAGGAMLAFFMLQLATFAIVYAVTEAMMWSLTIGFVVGGTVTLAFYLVRLPARGVPLAAELGMRARPRAALATTAIGVLVGGALGGLALLYLRWLEEVAPAQVPPVPPEDFVALLVLGVCAAPVIEELLFRGLLLGALRRSTSTIVALLWSSLVFTFVHPMASWPPVFLVGVACAALRHRGGFLPACMVLHAVYNAIVIGLR
ncbi:MAG: lysostaphin resistance A-like protein [Planctomycetota bacterium]